MEINKLLKQSMESTIPNEWREAIDIPTLKKGDKRGHKNYRGINILSTCYKIYSKIIKPTLQQYSEKFIPEEQNGFRKGCSCADTILTLKVIIE
jgi:hypothetical protein